MITLENGNLLQLRETIESLSCVKHYKNDIENDYVILGHNFKNMMADISHLDRFLWLTREKGSTLMTFNELIHDSNAAHSLKQIWNVLFEKGEVYCKIYIIHFEHSDLDYNVSFEEMSKNYIHGLINDLT